MNLFEIERVGQTYEYVGFKGMMDALSPAKPAAVSVNSPVDLIRTGVVAGMSSVDKVSGISRRLQVNMETGKPY